MSELDPFDKLLIRSIKKYDYMFNGDRTSSAKEKRQKFYKTFTAIVKKKKGYQGTGEMVKSRWRRIRENYVTAAKKGEDRRTPLMKALISECSFLQPFIKPLKKQGSCIQGSNDLGNDMQSKAYEYNEADDEEEQDILMNDDDTNGSESNTSVTYDSEDPMNTAEADQMALNNLCNEVNLQVGKSRTRPKRDAISNLQSDFAKKPKEQSDKNSEIFQNQLEALSAKVDDLISKQNTLLQARARAVLVCKYVDALPMARQIEAVRRILRILKEYEKK